MLKVVTLKVVVSDADEAQIVANQMANSMIAQEGFFTLECGHVEDPTDEDLVEVFSQVPEDVLVNNYYLDKNGEPIEEGGSVQVDATDENHDFLGTVTEYRGKYVVVEDMEGNSFCILPNQLEIEE